MGLVALVNHGAADGRQRRKNCKQYLGVDRFQHHVSKSGKIGLPGVAFVRRAHVIGRALLLNERSCIQVLCRGVPLLHVRETVICEAKEAGLQNTLRLHLSNT